MMRTKRKKLGVIFLCMCVAVSMLLIPRAIKDTHAEDSSIDLGVVFKEWINYPDASLGSGYSAGWGYDASSGALKTSQNVGFTGYYNPYLMSFTTGTWGIDFQSGDTDPWGFVWGLKTWKNESNQDCYSFYVYEECGHNRWSISYIDEWIPAKDGGSHRGPVYHSTISAADSQYADHNGGMGSVGFATGKTLAYGSVTVQNVRHRITIDATKNKITLTNSVADFKLLGTNGSNAVQQGNSIIVDAQIQAGSFGPVTASNDKAYFYNLSMEAREDNGAIRADFQPYSNGVPTYAGKAGEPVRVENTSWLDPDTKATIKSEEWVITYCDPENGDVEIYNGSTPFEGTFEKDGEYKIYLRIVSSQGLSARKTKYFTVTGDNTLTVKYVDEDGNKLCDDFIYKGKPGTPYQTSALSFDGYKLYSVDGEENGVFSDKPFAVTYTYKPLGEGENPGEGEEAPMEVGKITVQYVDEDGNALLPELTYKAEIGDAFKTSSLHLPGYTYQGLATDSAAETGRYGFQEKTVTYVYKKDASTASSAGTVLIRYVDREGNTVSSDMLVNSDVGSLYSVNRRSILGYRLVRIDGANEDGNVTINNNVQVVYVVYEHATYTASSVVVKYLDTEGNTIRPDDVYNGDAGDSFSVKPAYIKGYKFFKIYEEPETADLSVRAMADFADEDEEVVDLTAMMMEVYNAEKEYDADLLTEEPEEKEDGSIEGVFEAQKLQIITYVYNQFTNIDLDGNGEPDINIDVDNNGKPDINVDTDGDGDPDVNIVDKDGDGDPDINIVDKDKDGKPDKDIDNRDPKNPVDPDVNIDINDNGIPDINVDIDGDGKPDVNIDSDGDGKPDINVIDKDEDGDPDLDIVMTPEDPVVPDVNVDTDGDGDPDINIVDKDGDGKPDPIDPNNPNQDKTPDVNVDRDGDGKPDINVDTDGDDKPDMNVDMDKDGQPDINIDIDDDGKADLNIDTDGDGKADLNIDSTGDGKADLNLDRDGDGIADANIDTDGDGKADKNLIGAVNTSDSYTTIIYSFLMIISGMVIVLLKQRKGEAK